MTCASRNWSLLFAFAVVTEVHIHVEIKLMTLLIARQLVQLRSRPMKSQQDQGGSCKYQERCGAGGEMGRDGCGTISNPVSPSVGFTRVHHDHAIANAMRSREHFV
jgi:hypothetical protein